MNWQRSNARQRFHPDSEPQNVTKQKPNKRKVFNDSDDEEQAEQKKGGKRKELAGKQSSSLVRQRSVEFSDDRNNNSRSYNSYKVAPQCPDLRNQGRLQANRRTAERFTQSPHNESVQYDAIQQPRAVNTRSSIFSFDSIHKKDTVWSHLSIRGPYQDIFSRLCDSTVKNRPLCKMIKLLLAKVYRNAIEYRDKDIPNLTRHFNHLQTPTIEDAIAIAEEMCQKLFRFVDDDGVSIDLYEDNMISALKILFFAKKLNVQFATKIEILQRLKSICDSKNFHTIGEELEDVRNALVFYTFVLAKSLFSHLFSIDVHQFPGQVAFRREASIVMEPSMVYSNSNVCRFPRGFAMYRIHSSLWVTIPYGYSDHLLESVLDYGLIQLLPAEAKSFLDRWLLDVRNRMRTTLGRGDLIRKIKEFMVGSDHNEKMSPDDVRVENIILSVLDDVLNTKEFSVFDSEWKDSVMNLIKTMREHRFLLNNPTKRRFRDITEKLNPGSLEQFSSFFPYSPKYKTLISNCLQQILNFVIRFAMSTIRQIIRVENFMFTLDVLDDQATDFESFSDETKKEPLSSFTTKPPRDENAIRQRFSESSSSSSLVIKPSAHGNKRLKTAKNELSFSSYVPLEEPPTKRPKTQLSNNSTMSEVTEEELNNARALRPSSVVSASRDIFEEVPEEWVIIGKAELEKNKKLIAELERSRERLDTLLSRVD